ncbi:hypothetical protein PLESTF_000052800 [Pleodorina starrii]|nr:hypothetical protein PLESTF_000052800 [Pleodorina starrii]
MPLAQDASPGLPVPSSASRTKNFRTTPTERTPQYSGGSVRGTAVASVLPARLPSSTLKPQQAKPASQFRPTAPAPPLLEQDNNHQEDDRAGRQEGGGYSAAPGPLQQLQKGSEADASFKHSSSSKKAGRPILRFTSVHGKDDGKDDGNQQPSSKPVSPLSQQQKPRRRRSSYSAVMDMSAALREQVADPPVVASKGNDGGDGESQSHKSRHGSSKAAHSSHARPRRRRSSYSAVMDMSAALRQDLARPPAGGGSFSKKGAVPMYKNPLAEDEA